MSIAYNSSIVRDGLVLYLDAGNTKSYPGSGTTWFDISGNGRNLSWQNNPTYTSGGNGYFTLNGTDQYGTISSYSGINFNNSTIIYVAWLDSSPNERNTIFSQYYGGNGPQFEWQWSSGNLRSGFRQNSAATPENNAGGNTGVISLSTVTSVTVTYQAGTVTHYKNSVLLGNNVNSTQTDVNGGGNIDIGRNSSAGLYFKGRVHMCLIYNRVLTNNEIILNFEATRGRYGI